MIQKGKKYSQNTIVGFQFGNYPLSIKSHQTTFTQHSKEVVGTIYVGTTIQGV